uniref:Peptidase M50B-like protein n=1 Tax=Ananas comosus var. bracteatus TaxID=296719 RepID=A0A6V7QFS6_ANACO|nr:unnamed protein product [Ananas comosus var. bracteatus]
MINWELKNCCDRRQVVFIACIGVFIFVILALWRTVLLTPFKLITVFLHETSHALACKLTCGDVEGMQVHANEVAVLKLVAASIGLSCLLDLGSSFWGMVFILASTNLLTTRIAAGCFILALFVVLFVAKNWTLRGLCIGFIIFLAIVWVLQETTKFRILRYVILFIDIYDDLISRRVHSSDAEKFAEICPCPCTGVGWGIIWPANYSLLCLQGYDLICFSMRIHLPWACHFVLSICVSGKTISSSCSGPSIIPKEPGRREQLGWPSNKGNGLLPSFLKYLGPRQEGSV